MVFDLGCGWGSWGLILRVQEDYTGVLIGLDIHLPWVQRLQRLGIYNRVHWADCRKFQEYGKPDLCLAADLLEHLTREEAEDLLDKLAQVPYVFISTPLIQDSNPGGSHWTGNKAMKHQIGLSQEELEARGYTTKLVRLRYFPRWLKPFLWVRERITGKTVAEHEILAWRVWTE